MYVFIYRSNVGSGQWPARYVEAHQAGPARFFPVCAGFGHVPRHVGQPDPAESVNGPCLARPYSYRAETSSDRVRAGWPVWTSIAPPPHLVLNRTNRVHRRGLRQRSGVG
jgi:hypothetical protein